MYVAWVPVTVVYLRLVNGLARSRVLLRWLPARSGTASSQPQRSEPVAAPARFDGLRLAAVLTLAILTWGLSDHVLSQFALTQYTVLALTIVALVVANAAPAAVSSLVGDREIGTMMMYVFFGTLATTADLSQFGLEAVWVVAFIGLAVGIHTALILLLGRLSRADLFEPLAGSVAGIGGPATAAAVASSIKRRDLIAPGILTGLLGFALGTIAGIAVYRALIQASWRTSAAPCTRARNAGCPRTVVSAASRGPCGRRPGRRARAASATDAAGIVRRRPPA